MLNRVDLIGHLGADPEVRMTRSNDPVANVNLATTDRWKDDNGVKHEKTEWHRLVMFNRIADLAQKYLKKGALLHVSGKLRTTKWEKDGNNRYTTEVIVSELHFLDKKKADDVGAVQ